MVENIMLVKIGGKVQTLEFWGEKHFQEGFQCVDSG